MKREAGSARRIGDQDNSFVKGKLAPNTINGPMAIKEMMTPSPLRLRTKGSPV